MVRPTIHLAFPLLVFLLSLTFGCENAAEKKRRREAAAIRKRIRQFEAESIQRVKECKGKLGKTVAQNLAFFVQLSNKSLAKHGLSTKAIPSWSATCTRSGVCQVKLSVQSGKESVEGIWMVRKKEVQPLNDMARGFQRLGYKAPTNQKAMTKRPNRKEPGLSRAPKKKPALDRGAPLIVPR